MIYPLQNWSKIKRGSQFGEKTFYSLHHLGTDYIVPEGTPVFAPRECEIVVAGNFPEGGNTVHTAFADPLYGKVVLRFMHLKSFSKMGKYKKGSVLGFTGNTGKLTEGPHLHLDISREKVEIKNFKNFIDPEKFFDRLSNSGGKIATT